MGFVMRRSLPSVAGLVGLLLAMGAAAVVLLDAPVWFPAAFALVMLAVQYAVNPWVIRWLVPATLIDHDGERYATDHVLGEIVARRCRDAGVPLVTLGIVDDGNPNAFTFGHTPGDARVWVTRGLLERLDDRELDAVVSHEVGHIKHWDFVVMTVAAVVPMVLYLLYLVARRSDRQEARAVALGAFVAYWVAQITLLSLSRARETAADHWSCEITGDGDALASALVRIAYGMGQVQAEQKSQVAALMAEGRQGRRQAASLESRFRRAQSMRAMGIFEPSSAEAMQAVWARGIDPERAVAAMRWDVLNPWGRTLERLSSHPLVARRIEALERSGLPGAPARWSVLRATATSPPEEVAALRARFAGELAIAVGPWAILALLLVGSWAASSLFAVGVALTTAGALFLLKQRARYPGGHQPVDEIASLLERIDAGPIAGVPVVLRGQVAGRGVPGYVLSPDLVIADSSGFVPLLYRQPISLLASAFGLFRAADYLGQDVVAVGWYRRLPGPAVELWEVRTADGRRSRAWLWLARHVTSGLLLAVGLFVMLLGAAGL